MYRKSLTLILTFFLTILLIPQIVNAQTTLRGPWLWMIAPTEPGKGGAESTEIDSLHAASGGEVTEHNTAFIGTREGETVGDYQWTRGELPENGDLHTMLMDIGMTQDHLTDYSCYGLITIVSPREQTVYMPVSSDDSIKVWNNGQVIHRNAVNRSLLASDAHHDLFFLKIFEGENLFMVKVSQGKDQWGLKIDLPPECTTKLPNVDPTEQPTYDGFTSVNGPYFWMLTPVQSGRGGAAATDVDSLSTASNGAVTEADIVIYGAREGDTVGNYQWTPSVLPINGDINEMLVNIGMTDNYDLDHHTSYALITIVSEADQRNVPMAVNSDDSIKVWLNGQVVYRNAIDRPFRPGHQDRFSVNLNAGENLMMVKVSEGGFYWNMWVGIDAEFTTRLPSAKEEIRRQHLQSDEFDGTELGSIWHVQNADQGSHTLMDGKLVVEGAFRQNLWAVDTTTRFYQLTYQQQFSVETTMNIEQRHVSTIAGLVIKSPTTKDTNGRDGEVVMLKLWGHGSANEQGLIGNMYNNQPIDIPGTPNTAFLYFQSRERGLPTKLPDYKPKTGNIQISMRMERNGNNYKVWFKPNAQGNWIHFGETMIALEDPIEVGVFVGITQAEAMGGLTVSFDNFLINQPIYNQPIYLEEDVNKDGVVNVLDLVLVGRSFGASGEIPTDVNGDGSVNVLDLVLVGNAIGNTVSAPTLLKQMEGLLTRTMVEDWLRDARKLNLSDPAVQRGIMVLEDLLKTLTPKATALLPNYPNPFNPETWIPYQLAIPSDVSILIYASDGKLIRKLDLGHQPIGKYHHRSNAAHWDGKNAQGEPVASGVYFYTFTAGEFSATRKMLIRK